uniref:Uncharacterized protein n=1 Tax=Percolomonas cosmopolitus TaxID=63605 RepID=A0A7S1KR71_9EUKA
MTNQSFYSVYERPRFKTSGYNAHCRTFDNQGIHRYSVVNYNDVRTWIFQQEGNKNVTFVVAKNGRNMHRWVFGRDSDRFLALARDDHWRELPMPRGQPVESEEDTKKREKREKKDKWLKEQKAKKPLVT